MRIIEHLLAPFFEADTVPCEAQCTEHVCGHFLLAEEDQEPTRQLGFAVVGNKHRTLLGGVGFELASYSF